MCFLVNRIHHWGCSMSPGTVVLSVIHAWVRIIQHMPALWKPTAVCNNCQYLVFSREKFSADINHIDIYRSTSLRVISILSFTTKSFWMIFFSLRSRERGWGGKEKGTDDGRWEKEKVMEKSLIHCIAPEFCSKQCWTLARTESWESAQVCHEGNRYPDN